MNHMLKTGVLSGVLVLCVTLFGCAVSPSSAPSDETETSSAVNGATCAAFCRSEGGPFYVSEFAASEAACTQKGGDWFSDPGGCCCECARPGSCL